MTVFYEFDDVDEFSAAVVGEPGARTFFLNARSGGERVTVRCEKQQVKAISMYLRHVLKDLPPAEHKPIGAVGGEPSPPADPAFVLGPIGLGYDRRNDRLLVQFEELLESDITAAAADEPGDVPGDLPGDVPGDALDDDATARGHIRFYVTRDQADSFCDHADRLVAAGRPQCTWCGNPIDPDGHACPRMN